MAIAQCGPVRVKLVAALIRNEVSYLIGANVRTIVDTVRLKSDTGVFGTILQT
jgi:hypothetical protein